MNIKRLLLVLLSITLGITFLYSAWTKLETLQKFEYTIVEYVHFSWFWAAIAARGLIGLEAALGVLLLLHLYGPRKIVLNASIAILILFSIYLGFLWANVGNDVNCGCFGDAIMMTPLESLIKNAVMLLILVLLVKFHKGFTTKIPNIISLVLLIAITISPVIIYGLPETKPQWLNKDHFRLDLTALYAEGKADKPLEDLTKGKRVIFFLSLKCPHCKIAAYKAHVMKEQNPSLPFFMVLAGNKKYMADFWKETKAQNIPYTTLDADSFTNLVGFSWPVIYYVKDGWVEAQTNYISLSKEEVENWLLKP